MNGKRIKILLIIQVISLVLVTIAIIGVVLYFIEQRDVSEGVEKNKERIESLEVQKIRLEDKIKTINSSIYIPQKGVDYFDGKDGIDGRDGKDSKNTHTIEKTTVIEQVPVDGLTPEIYCNIMKNRWEVRYKPSDVWRVLKSDELPVKCTITKDDILEVLEEIL